MTFSKVLVDPVTLEYDDALLIFYSQIAFLIIAMLRRNFHSIDLRIESIAPLDPSPLTASNKTFEPLSSLHWNL